MLVINTSLHKYVSMSNAVTVVIPQALRERARDHRINISEVARNALTDAVMKAENETGVVSGKTSPGYRSHGGQG